MTDDLLKLYIEPTSRCNLTCGMCFRNTWTGEEFSDMDIRVFDNALETMPPGVRTVFFGGMGEPLFHRDIIYMVERAARKNVRVELLTNGTLLTRDMSSKLLDAGLNMLWVSLDSVGTGGYEEIGHSGGLSLVKRNISEFNSERVKRENRAELGIAFVAMKSNVRQLGQLSRFAFENNVSRVNVSNALPTDSASLSQLLYSRTVSLELGTSAPAYPVISLPMMDGKINEVRDGVADLLKTDFVFAPPFGEPVFRKRRYCKFIGDGASFVRHDGDVAPCMALLHSGITYLEDNKRVILRHSFGNAGSRSLGEIWSSTEYTDFRRRVRDFEFSPCIQCGGCENRDDNQNDCIGNRAPTCGACLWSEGVISCP